MIIIGFSSQEGSDLIDAVVYSEWLVMICQFKILVLHDISW